MLAIIITGVECVIVPAHTWDYIRTPGTASSERCIRFGKCRAELVFLPRALPVAEGRVGTYVFIQVFQG